MFFKKRVEEEELPPTADRTIPDKPEVVTSVGYPFINNGVKWYPVIKSDYVFSSFSLEWITNELVVEYFKTEEEAEKYIQGL